MTDERLMDTWSRLEVEWKEALEQAVERQHEYDSRMTNHLVYHFAAPDPAELDEIKSLWQAAAEKRQAADEFIRQHNRETEGEPDYDQ